MIKTSKINAELQPHQQKALEKALVGNLILAHSMGSGKTLTSIAIADALGVPATVLTPASLVDNYKKELKKFKRGGPKIDVMSLPTAAARDYQIPEGNTLIVDEMHNIRTPATLRHKYVKDQVARAGRVIGLTGTPTYNEIYNIAPLVNLIAKNDVLPQSPGNFMKRYTSDEIVDPGGFLGMFIKGHKSKLNNTKELKDILNKYVDAFETDVEKPERVEEFIKVPMSDKQRNIYNYVEGKIPLYLRAMIQLNLPVSKRDQAKLNSFLSGVRQVSNSTRQYDVSDQSISNKLSRAVEEIKNKYKTNKKLRALVYSNFLDSGVIPYKEELDRAGISNAVFSGELSRKEKKDIVDKYNSGKLNVILGTSSASEGLDLKNTNLIQILEPHFNNSKIEQVIGRGIRYKSHESLPKEQRKVLVQRYLSELEPNRKPGWFSGRKRTSVDEYLKSRAEEKDELVRQVKELFK